MHGVARAGARQAIEAAGARAVVDGELAAIVSEAAGDTRAADLMRRHWKLLEELAEDATVVPVQFGTAMASESAVTQEFLAPRRHSLESQLASFEGKVQLSVKGTYDEAALLRSIVEGSPAVAQLRERIRGLSEAAGHFERVRLGELVAAEVDHVRERDAGELHARLDGLAVANHGEPASGLQGAFNSAFLVERERVDAFEHAVAQIAWKLGDRITLRLLGPLPPYAFVAEEAPAWA